MTRMVGARRRAPGLGRVAALAFGVCLTAAAPAAARDFCGGLRQAMTHAAQEFRSLRLALVPMRARTYPARSLIPGGRQCEIRELFDGVEYRCRMTRSGARPAEARAAYRRDVARVRNCLAGRRAEGHGDFAGAAELSGAVSWRLAPGLRAAVAFVVAEDVFFVADTGEEPDQTASWIVVDKGRPRR
jgi:hypothetical protein